MSLHSDTLFTPAAAALDTEPASIVAATAPRTATERGEHTFSIQPKYGYGSCAITLRYLWHGAAGAPTVIAVGGISANRDVCATHTDAEAGWWEKLVGADRAIDLNRFRVLGIDWLTAEQLPGAHAVSSEDQADAIAALLTRLGIARAHALVGSSYGAMVGLALAARHPQRLRRVVAISGAHRPHPLATALRHIQREIVRAGARSGDLSNALSLARQLAMTTYRGADEFAQRFDGAPELRDGRFHFPVGDYLQNAGARFVARFDARRFLALSESIDLHRVDPAAIQVPTTLVAVRNDRLVPVEDLRALAAGSAAPTTLHEFDSLYGHDAFLKEPAVVGAIVRAALSC